MNTIQFGALCIVLMMALLSVHGEQYAPANELKKRSKRANTRGAAASTRTTLKRFLQEEEGKNKDENGDNTANEDEGNKEDEGNGKEDEKENEVEPEAPADEEEEPADEEDPADAEEPAEDNKKQEETEEETEAPTAGPVDEPGDEEDKEQVDEQGKEQGDEPEEPMDELADETEMPVEEVVVEEEPVDEEIDLNLDPTNVEDAYTYQKMATYLLTQVDEAATLNGTDARDFYLNRVASVSAENVFWEIDAGSRQSILNGTDEVGGLFESFATRSFSFHQPSHFESFYDDAGVLVSLKYHGVVAEDGGNYQDIFGNILEHFNEDGLLDYVYVQRTKTIDRPYGEFPAM